MYPEHSRNDVQRQANEQPVSFFVLGTSGERMTLVEFLKQLDELVASATSAFVAAANADALEAARIEYVGAKKGRMKAVQKVHGTTGRGRSPGRPACG